MRFRPDVSTSTVDEPSRLNSSYKDPLGEVVILGIVRMCALCTGPHSLFPDMLVRQCVRQAFAFAFPCQQKLEKALRPRGTEEPKHVGIQFWGGLVSGSNSRPLES